MNKTTGNSPLKCLFLLLTIICLINSQTANLQKNQPTLDRNIRKSSLDITDYQVFTLDNGFKLLVAVNPAYTGQLTYGIMVNAGGLQNQHGFSRLDQLTLDAITYGSKNYQQIDSLDRFVGQNNVTVGSYGGLSDSSIIANAPTSNGKETIERINDAFVNPIISDSAVESSVNDIIDMVANIRNSKDISINFRTYFLNYFGSEQLKNAYDYSSSSVQKISKLGISQIKNAISSHLNTFYSGDNMVGILTLQKLDQNLIDLAVEGLTKLPNRKASSKLNSASPLIDLSDATPLYYRFNTQFGKQGMRIHIVPVDGVTPMKEYAQIRIINELVNSKNSLIDSLKSQFEQIGTVSNGVITFLDRYSYPLIQIDIIFKSKTHRSQQIYNYVIGFMNREWTPVIQKYGKQISKSLSYHFDLVSYDQDVQGWMDQIHQRLRNLVNLETQQALNGNYNTGYPNYQTVSPKFKVIAIEISNITLSSNKIDGFTGAGYQIIKPSAQIPKVNQPIFVLNPYSISIPATLNQNKKSIQNWAPFKNNSIVFAPNSFIYEPFTSVSSILRYQTANLDSNFQYIFVQLLLHTLKDDISLIKNIKIQHLVHRNQISVIQTGLKDSMFLFYNKLYSQLHTQFYSQQDFNTFKQFAKDNYNSFFQVKPIKQILEQDQYIAENKALKSRTQLLSTIDDYSFSTFKKNHQTFMKQFSVEWLVVTFLQDISNFKLAINNLHKQWNLPFYTVSSPTSMTSQKVNVFTHLGQKRNALLIYADFKQLNLESFIQLQIIDTVLNPLLNKFDGNNSYGINGNIHFTQDGRIGYNIQTNSATLNSSNLQNVLKSLGDFIGKQISWEEGSSEDLTFRADVINKLSLKNSKYLADYTQQLNEYLLMGCWQCILDWPKLFKTQISSVSLNKLKANAIYGLNNELRVIQLPK